MWPAVMYEERPWHMDPDERLLIPKSRRRRILSTYEAAIPASIAGQKVTVSRQLLERMGGIVAELARFDEEQASRGYDLPALMLRSESAASSQIENLTSSVRNVALAELSDDAPQNARIIAGNVSAMRASLALSGDVSVEQVKEVHRTLMGVAGASFAGELRSEQVWVGGTPYSPHGALFVPPAACRVAGCLEDACRFAARDDVSAVAKAAIFHAQLETIHPFIDGNGRTGRALLHRILRQEGVLRNSTLPISAGLLHNIDAYMASIDAYQTGDPEPIIDQVVEALELSSVIGSRMAPAFDGVIAEMRESIIERAGSAIHRLPALLVEQPVVNRSYVAEHLGITPRAAANLVDKACGYGILRPLGGRRRGTFFQSDAIIDLLEEASSTQGIRRVLSARS